jgi:hypothetical protein
MGIGGEGALGLETPAGVAGYKENREISGAGVNHRWTQMNTDTNDGVGNHEGTRRDTNAGQDRENREGARRRGSPFVYFVCFVVDPSEPKPDNHEIHVTHENEGPDSGTWHGRLARGDYGKRT